MPVRNEETHLASCLKSILKQSYAHWELIIVNDNSTDDTACIIEKYVQIDSRISSYDNVGSGIIDALKLAYSHASGEYITRMDGDDLMDPFKISLLLNNLLRYGVGYVATGKVEYFKEGGIGKGYQQYANWLNNLTNNKENFNQIYRECTIPSPCWMLSRDDFEKIGAFNGNEYPEDYDLAFRMKLHGLKVVPVNKIIHYWRDHPHRATRNDPNYLDNRFLRMKVLYFLKMELNQFQLVLWGAGSKGKMVARQLIDVGQDFHWYTNNKNKIGQNIYGKVLQSEDELQSLKPKNVIVAVSGSKGKKYQSPLIDKNIQHDYHFFT